MAGLIAELRDGVAYEERDGRTVKVKRNPYAAWTIRGVLSPLSRVLGKAARSGMIAANPVARLEKGERPAVSEKDKRILSSDEIGKLLDAATDKYRPIVATGVFTGLRLGELLGLVWQDVDLEGGFIRVRRQLGPSGTRVEPTTKNAIRDVVLLPALGRLLKAHKEEAFRRGHAKPTDFVFASETGTPLQPRNVSRRGLEDAVETAGLEKDGEPKLTMHSLRDTFASHLILDLHLDVVQVSRLLGHAKPSITANTYARLFDQARHAEAIRQAMAASSFGNAMETKGGERWRTASGSERSNVSSLS